MGGQANSTVEAQKSPVGLPETAPIPSMLTLLDRAQQQYPILRDKGILFTDTPNTQTGNMLEAWPPDETGDPSYPRPKEFPMGQYGIQNFSPETTPNDVAGDVVSHFLVNSDPALKPLYEQFTKTFDTPEGQDRLRQDYSYARQNEGERRPMKDWAQADRIPAYLRGRVFKQFPEKAQTGAYTPDQIQILDQIQALIQGGKR